MEKSILNKFKEACISILPVIIAIVITIFATPGLSVEVDGKQFGPAMTSLLISIVPLLIGTTLFSLGAEKSIAEIGSVVAATLTKRKTISLLLFVGALMGFLVTLAEPDLGVLASRLSLSSRNWMLVVICSVGVGLFMLIAIIRVAYNKSLKYWLIMGYGLVFGLGLIADKTFFTVVFDGGGVTTGVVTVPFILSLGVGVARVLGGKNSEDNSFGYSGLCSLGTVLAAMLFCIIIRNTGELNQIKSLLEVKVGDGSMFSSIPTYQKMGNLYVSNLLAVMIEVAISMVPITIFFFVYSYFFKMKRKMYLSIIVGLIETYIGLVFFLVGAESGFIPVASSIGIWLSSTSSPLHVFIIIGFILGFISMLAEPAVKVLANNVSEVSQGVISQKMIYATLCLASGIAIILNVIRVYLDIDYSYFIIPLFIIALLLALASPEIYVGISIDAAGVATGTMASCFFLPLFIAYTANRYQTDFGSSSSYGEAIMRNGFGVVGIMSVMPIISIELIGIFAVVKNHYNYKKALSHVLEADDSQVIHLPSYELAEESI